MGHGLRVTVWTGNTPLMGPPSLRGVGGLTGQTCRRPKDSNVHRVDSLSHIQSEPLRCLLLIIIHEEVHGNIRTGLRSPEFLLMFIYCFHIVFNLWTFCFFLSHEALWVLSSQSCLRVFFTYRPLFNGRASLQWCEITVLN